LFEAGGHAAFLGQRHTRFLLENHSRRDNLVVLNIDGRVTDIELSLREIRHEDMYWIQLALNGALWRRLLKSSTKPWFHKWVYQELYSMKLYARGNFVLYKYDLNIMNIFNSQRNKKTLKGRVSIYRKIYNHQNL
jgi:hypothetical protein